MADKPGVTLPSGSFPSAEANRSVCPVWSGVGLAREGVAAPAPANSARLARRPPQSPGQRPVARQRRRVLPKTVRVGHFKAKGDVPLFVLTPWESGRRPSPCRRRWGVVSPVAEGGSRELLLPRWPGVTQGGLQAQAGAPSPPLLPGPSPDPLPPPPAVPSVRGRAQGSGGCQLASAVLVTLTALQLTSHPGPLSPPP